MSIICEAFGVFNDIIYIGLISFLGHSGEVFDHNVSI